jgi:hypothetical protein
MFMPFARPFLRRHLAVAAVLIATVGACARESPTELTLETSPYAEFNGIFCGCPLNPGGPTGQLVAAGVVGQPITISLAVVDRNGHSVSGVPISWSVVHNGGSTDLASSTTGSTGLASVAWTLDTIAKTDSLAASIASGATMIVTATALHGSAFAATKISGDSQTVALGEASEPFIVKLTDRYGNPVNGVAVGWVVNGGGTLSALTTATDANGTTQVTLSTDASTPGVHQIVATFGVVRASTFTLTATTPASQVRRIQVVTHPIPF